MHLLLLIVFAVFFPSGAYEGSEGCYLSYESDSTYYCEGFERGFPPKGWGISGDESDLYWDLIHWYGPNDLLPQDYCHGEFYIYPKNFGNEDVEYKLETQSFKVKPDWQNMLISFSISKSIFDLPEGSFTIYLVRDGDDNSRTMVYPCKDSSSCSQWYDSTTKPWATFFIDIGHYIYTDSNISFIFSYVGSYSNAFGLDNIIVSPNAGYLNSNDFPAYRNYCDFTSNYPPKRDGDDDDDDGCGCGAVDSGAGGSGFFAFALLVFCLILLYRKRARVV